MPMTSAQGIERERKRTAARMAQKRAEREAAEREAKLASQGKARGDDLQVNGESSQQGTDSQPGAAIEVGAGKVPFWQLSPAWQASQARKAGQAAAGQPVPVGANPPNNVEAAQSLALDALAIYAVKAAHYLGRVATGRAKGEQWQIRASSDVLDRLGVTGATVAAARERAAGADAASLAPLLARLAQAQALAARKAGATDAQIEPDSGQTSGTQNAD